MNKNIVLSFGLFLGAAANAATCTYKLDPSSTKVGWTAFKTMKKVGVNGSFEKFAVNGENTADSFKKLAEGLTVVIDRNSAKTGDPARDATLKMAFFGKLPTSNIEGRLADVKGDDKSGTATLNLTVDGKIKPVAMKYSTETDGTLQAVGSIDMIEMGMSAAFDSLHKACRALHTGADGVSKTWTDVVVTLKGKIAKDCK